MTSLSFIGLGLNNENGISIQGMDIAKKADIAMIELYTNFMPELDLENLSKLVISHRLCLNTCSGKLHNGSSSRILAMRLEDINLVRSMVPILSLTQSGLLIH